MNFKTTFVLFVLVVLGALLWLYSDRNKPTGEEPESATVSQPEPRYVLEQRPETDKVKRIEFSRQDKPKLVFERQSKAKSPGGQTEWAMLEPVNGPAESYMVSGLSSLLTGLQYRREFNPGDDAISLADAGLEPPVAIIKLVDEDDHEYAVEIGKSAALSNDTYVRVVGTKAIKVVARDMSRELDREVKDYRAKHLLKFTSGDARHLRIEHEGKTYDFTRGDDQQWVINEPIKAYALSDKVRKIVDALGRVRVKDFVENTPDSLDEFGLTTPFLTITVNTEKTEQIEPESKEDAEPTTQPASPEYKTIVGTYTLAVGNVADLKSESRYVKPAHQQWVASVAETDLKDLVPNLSQLRDPRVTRVKADDITQMELVNGTDTAVLTKVAGRWQGTGDLVNIETEAVTALLQTFEDLNATDFVDDPGDPAQYGLTPPRATLSATTVGAVEPVVLEIGANTPSGRSAYARVSGQTSLLVISSKLADELAIKPIALRSREITTSTPGQIKRLDINRPEMHYVLERKPDGRTWTMLEPADTPPNSTAVRELVNDLARLRAKQVVGLDDGGSFGLDSPLVTIGFDVEHPVEGPPPPPDSQEPPQLERISHTLMVGRQDKRTYARFDQIPYVFELDETVFQVLTAEFIRPGLFDLKAEDVTHLKIEAPGGTVEFQLVDETWIYPPDKFLQLSQKKVGDFIKELAELRVAAYMAYRDGDLEHYGLTDAPVTVTLNVKDESAITLKLTQLRPGELPRKAAWVERQRVFMLRQAEAEKLMRGLDYYIKPETAQQPKQSEPE